MSYSSIVSKTAFILSFFSLLAACASVDQSDQTQLPADLIACKDPRPQICTMIYDPVCAYDQQGQSTTASSDCQACSNDMHVGFIKGACADEQVDKTVETPSLNY